ncbi:PREDICTED: ATP synthase subunit g, mitochondrial [Nicrophorus vespilloides]|uniref:ATP synthase subunit g, mitochondrial n=1 Tax=Nicrophorus vespilloides TaxID=110193 RepID=A0ABM1MEK2_NICVS|nr:PREDICTED: ATP synthase subunit g, mitochondrial [Nicrophorus vespilloides]
MAPIYLYYWYNWLKRSVKSISSLSSQLKAKFLLGGKMAAKVSGLVKQLLSEGRPKVQTFLKYAKVELTPPSPGDIPQIRAGIANIMRGAKTGKWKEMPIREAWLNTLITVEVLCWFYVGECIGKRHIVGYDV